MQEHVHFSRNNSPPCWQCARGRPQAACQTTPIDIVRLYCHKSLRENIRLLYSLVPPILCFQRVLFFCQHSSNTLHSHFLASGSRTMSHGQFYVVDSQKVQYNSDRDALISTYDYQTSHVDRCPDGRLRVTPITKTLTFRTSCRVPRVGCMLVGWGGNNGSTVTATVLANKLKIKWRTKDGIKVSYTVSVIVVYESN